MKKNNFWLYTLIFLFVLNTTTEGNIFLSIATVANSLLVLYYCSIDFYKLINHEKKKKKKKKLSF